MTLRIIAQTCIRGKKAFQCKTVSRTLSGMSVTNVHRPVKVDVSDDKTQTNCKIYLPIRPTISRGLTGSGKTFHWLNQTDATQSATCDVPATWWKLQQHRSWDIDPILLPTSAFNFMLTASAVFQWPVDSARYNKIIIILGMTKCSVISEYMHSCIFPFFFQEHLKCNVIATTWICNNWDYTITWVNNFS